MILYLSVHGESEAEDSVEIGEEGAVKGHPGAFQVVRQHWLESPLGQVKNLQLLRIAFKASLLMLAAAFSRLKIVPVIVSIIVVVIDVIGGSFAVFFSLQ